MEIKKLEICKFFDVKTPIRGTKKSACYDLHIPRISNEFIIAFCKRNKCFFDILDNSTVFFISDNYDWEATEKIDESTLQKPESKYERNYYDSDELNLIFCYYTTQKSYTVFRDCTIPSGIGFNIPENHYIDFAPRSSNFANGYTSIKSVIDEDYVFGTGIQINLLRYDFEEESFKCVTFEEDERIAQFMVKEYSPVEELIVIDECDWTKKPEICEKLTTRKGGFGHTGK